MQQLRGWKTVAERVEVEKGSQAAGREDVPSTTTRNSVTPFE